MLYPWLCRSLLEKLYCSFVDLFSLPLAKERRQREDAMQETSSSTYENKKIDNDGKMSEEER